jgi:hypothetical protein
VGSYSKVANGNVSPARFVYLDSSADGKVLQASAATQKLFGISQAGTRRAPYSGLDDGYAAIAGENLQVYGLGEQCMLELAGTVAPGDRLTATSGGKGIKTTTNLDEYGAIAQAAGSSGQLVPVLVQGGQISA